MENGRNFSDSFVIASMCVMLSYFNGGVRYGDGDVHFPPVWVQLGRNFLIYFFSALITVYAIRGIDEIAKIVKKHIVKIIKKHKNKK